MVVVLVLVLVVGVGVGVGVDLIYYLAVSGLFSLGPKAVTRRCGEGSIACPVPIWLLGVLTCAKP